MGAGDEVLVQWLVKLQGVGNFQVFNIIVVRTEK